MRAWGIALPAVGIMVSAFAFPFSTSVLAAQASDALTPELQKLRQALDKYRDPIAAVHDGYFSTLGCVEYGAGAPGQVPSRPADGRAFLQCRPDGTTRPSSRRFWSINPSVAFATCRSGYSCRSLARGQGRPQLFGRPDGPMAGIILCRTSSGTIFTCGFGNRTLPVYAPESEFRRSALYLQETAPALVPQLMRRGMAHKQMPEQILTGRCATVEYRIVSDSAPSSITTARDAGAGTAAFGRGHRSGPSNSPGLKARIWSRRSTRPSSRPSTSARSAARTSSAPTTTTRVASAFLSAVWTRRLPIDRRVISSSPRRPRGTRSRMDCRSTTSGLGRAPT